MAPIGLCTDSFFLLVINVLQVNGHFCLESVSLTKQKLTNLVNFKLVNLNCASLVPRYSKHVFLKYNIHFVSCTYVGSWNKILKVKRWNWLDIKIFQLTLGKQLFHQIHPVVKSKTLWPYVHGLRCVPLESDWAISTMQRANFHFFPNMLEIGVCPLSLIGIVAVCYSPEGLTGDKRASVQVQCNKRLMWRNKNKGFVCFSASTKSDHSQEVHKSSRPFESFVQKRSLSINSPEKA